MFLGILVLVVALLVVYFESKIREQNHKISSMISLISSLAEQMNAVNHNVHVFANKEQYSGSQPELNHLEEYNQKTMLIPVSDDESSMIDLSDKDSEQDSEQDSDEDNDIESDSDDDSDYEFDSDNDVPHNHDNLKVIDLISILEDDENVNELLDEVSLNDNENVKVLKLDISSDVKPLEEICEVKENNIVSKQEEDLETYDLENEDNEEQHQESISSYNLKSININLEDSTTDDIVDYKKMSLNKLRTTVASKGLSKESNKLKKHELLKLLGSE
jgi:hypothetical protein